MFKITAIVSLMLIATWSHADTRRTKKDATASEDIDPGSTLWAASLSCDSCGSECASACGTRHFRSCCFNYLRKKRGPDNYKFLLNDVRSSKQDQQSTLKQQKPQKSPVFIVESVPELLYNMFPSENKPNSFDEMLDNRMQVIYDV